MTLTIVLADAQRIVRQGLRALLWAEGGVRVVGEAADSPEAVRLVERLRPNVLVLDLMTSGPGGLEVVRRLADRSPQTRLVILSMHADTAFVAEAMRAGASAYVHKDSGIDELMHAIREVAAGRRFLSPALTEPPPQPRVSRAAASTDPFDTLTHREREVLQLTAEGNSGAAVARLLFISPRTVESHRANMMRKLGVRNQKELVRYATQHGLPSAEQPEEGQEGHESKIRNSTDRERGRARL